MREPCHFYWAGPFDRKVALAVKSFLVTQNLTALEPVLWLDSGTDLPDQGRSPYLAPLLPYLEMRRIDVAREVTAIHPLPAGSELPVGDRRHRSDFARLAILSRCGGIYFDCDMLFLRDLQALLTRFHDDAFCYRWSLQCYANTAVLRIPQGSDIGPGLIARACDSGSAKPNDLLRFEESADLDLLVLPSATFDPLWLHRDRKDILPDAPFDEFDDFFRGFDERFRMPSTVRSYRDFLSGAFTYHWHNRWNLPCRRDSWFGFLESQFDAMLAEKLGIRPPRVVVPVSGPAPTAATATRALTEEGIIGPLPLLTDDQCELVCRHLRHGNLRSPETWPKELAVHDRLIFELATRPAIFELVRGVLGDGFLLWGVQVIRRRAGQRHPWHVDVESAAADGGFLSIWIGLQGTTPQTSLRLVTRSHRVGASIQQLEQDNGLARGEADDGIVLGWARRVEPDARIVAPAAVNGDAIVFDGRVWHGSEHAVDGATRTALLLQYAAGARPVRIRDRDWFGWPFRYARTRPPVIAVDGCGDPTRNRLVDPPRTAAAGHAALSTVVARLSLPLQGDPGRPWRPHGLFRGPTPVVSLLGCHASVLEPGHCPHPPHAHAEEEVLIALDGEAQIVLGRADGSIHRTVRLARGSFAYYPAYRHHTIRNPGPGPITYLMFKWRAPPAETTATLDTRIVRCDPSPRAAATAGRHLQPLLEGPTGYLGRLHVHLTEMHPGAGYSPHRDPYDVAIVILAGTLETLGEEVGPHTVIFQSAGELHGMRNIGRQPARYLVFEFHPAAGHSIR